MWRVALLVVLTALVVPVGAQAEDEPGTEPASTEPVTPPTVELLDAGTKPLKKLRYAPKAGSSWDVVHVTESKQELSVGEMVAGKAGSTYRAEGTLQILAAKRGTPSQVAFRLTKVSYDMDDGTSAGIKATEDLSAETFQLFEGREVRASFDDRGLITSMDAEQLDDLPESLADAAKMVGMFLRVVVTPLPAEPIGVGARWKVTRSETAMGFTVRGTEEFTLVSRKGNRVETTRVNKVEADPQDVTSVAGLELPPGTKLRVEQVTSDAGLETATLFLDGLGSAATSSGGGRFDFSMTVGGVVQRLSMAIDSNERIEFAAAKPSKP